MLIFQPNESNRADRVISNRILVKVPNLMGAIGRTTHFIGITGNPIQSGSANWTRVEKTKKLFPPRGRQGLDVKLAADAANITDFLRLCRHLGVSALGGPKNSRGCGGGKAPHPAIYIYIYTYEYIYIYIYVALGPLD